ncbi:MAG: DNRLRE domain-containing protein [bacterium]
MKKKFLSEIILLLLIIILFITCAEYKKNPVGSEFFNSDEIGNVKTCVIYSSPSDTFFKYTNVKTGNSPYLNIGAVQNHNIKAKSLIKFQLDPDTTKIDSVSLTLYIHKFYEQHNGIFSCSIFKIAEQWDEDSLSMRNYSEGLQGEFITNFEVSVNDTVKSFTIPLPNDLVQSWSDSTTASKNHGLLFIPDNSQFITEFYSSEADSNQPELRMYTPTDTVSSYTEYFIKDIEDLFIAEGEFEATPDYLYISNGIATRSLLFFDVSVIPEQATINKAFVNIHSDVTAAFPAWQDTFLISIFETATEDWSMPDVPLDSLTYSTFLLDGDSALADITLSVQQWTSKTKENYGLLLKGRNEYINLDYRQLYSSKADSSKKPSLKIFYSLPPEENFNN